LVNVHIHQFRPGGAVADAAALGQFQQQWATYSKLVESDCLAQGEVGGILRATLNDVFTSPLSFLDIACGDASMMKSALRGTKVRHYHGIDLSQAALELAAAAPSFGADERNITIYNATGYGIKFIGVNPPGDDDFDENELSEVLRDGQSVYIKFNQADKGCNWTIKIEWAMAGYPSPLIPNVNLCTIDDIRLLYDRATGVTSYQTR